MSDLPNPINRYEKYLNAIATGNSDDLPTPITREEVFLDYIAKNGGGSGSGEVTGVKGNAEGSYRRGNVNLTPTHLGLGNVDNTSDLNKPVSTAQQTALDGKVDKVTGKGLSENDYTDADKAIVGGVTSALSDKVDKITGKGLSTNDYDNTAKGIVDGVTSALAGKVSTSSVGSANGVAELDANGRVPSSQLPSYVDDTVEGYLNSVDGKFYVDSSYTTEITGETGKIYVTLDTDKTYRWSGSGFVEISESLALGETSSTAYPGNKGKANADAITAIKDGANMDSFGDVETALQSYATKADVNIFHGTLNDWNNLSLADKIKYTDAMIEGQNSDNPVGNLNALTTTDKSSCVGAINEVNGGVIASVTADGVKTYSALFDELYALLSNATILYPERLKISVGGITILYVTTPFVKYGCCYMQANGNVSHSTIFLKGSGSMWRQSNISSAGAVTYDNLDAVVATNNQVISVIY